MVDFFSMSCGRLRISWLNLGMAIIFGFQFQIQKNVCIRFSIPVDVSCFFFWGGKRGMVKENPLGQKVQPGSWEWRVPISNFHIPFLKGIIFRLDLGWRLRVNVVIFGVAVWLKPFFDLLINSHSWLWMIWLGFLDHDNFGTFLSEGIAEWDTNIRSYNKKENLPANSLQRIPGFSPFSSTFLLYLTCFTMWHRSQKKKVRFFHGVDSETDSGS